MLNTRTGVFKSWVVVDIDHTLSDSTPRDHLLNSHRLDCDKLHQMTPEDWDRYHEGCINDEAHEDVLSLVKSFKLSGYKIALFTARPDKWQCLTEQWLLRNVVPYHALLMRPGHVKLRSEDLKIRMARHLFGDAFPRKIVCVLDDHPRVVEAFRKYGVTCMQVHTGEVHEAKQVQVQVQASQEAKLAKGEGDQHSDSREPESVG